ncbi:hypothetical protein [Reichenbachiella versicolor]|uniref:hypothetical protein n=1 Tax=Reichenbachiella versicolor TaxID=1821036 RepID=UPI0013A52D09|nr:hypothetical protein [Reichenbachiella versicolor]
MKVKSILKRLNRFFSQKSTKNLIAVMITMTIIILFAQNDEYYDLRIKKMEGGRKHLLTIVLHLIDKYLGKTGFYALAGTTALYFAYFAYSSYKKEKVNTSHK